MEQHARARDDDRVCGPEERRRMAHVPLQGTLHCYLRSTYRTLVGAVKRITRTRRENLPGSRERDESDGHSQNRLRSDSLKPAISAV